MDALLQLLPGEHIAAFPGRFHHLAPIGPFSNSCRYLGISGSTFKSQRFLCNNQQVLHALLKPNETHNSWDVHGFGRLIRPFLNKSESNQIVENPVKLNSLKVHGQYSLKHDSWRWCPLCTQEDQETIGIRYYHRDHQLTGVYHCPKHKVRLCSSCNDCGFKVDTLKDSLLPPQDNRCPKCNHFIEAADGYYDDVMATFEQKVLELISSSTQFKFRDFTRHISKYIGIDADAPLRRTDKQKMTDWKKYITSFLPAEVSKAYFKESYSSNNENRANGLLGHSRLYRVTNTSGVMHPLVHLISLKATNHSIFSNG